MSDLYPDGTTTGPWDDPEDNDVDREVTCNSCGRTYEWTVREWQVGQYEVTYEWDCPYCGFSNREENVDVYPGP